MKKNIRPLAVLSILCCMIFLFSCKKDLKNEPVAPPISNPDGFAIPAASPLQGSITGQIVDEHNAPVPSAEVSFAGTVYTTSVNGFFHINDVMLDKYVTTVTVHKAGYFKGIRSFSATPGRNYVNIKLIPKIITATINTANGGTAALSNGTNLVFPANGIVVKSTGATYTGSMQVYAAFIDPTTTDFGNVVPGNMVGQDATNMFALQSAGMIAVELETPSGEALQLASGKTASLKMPIPASILDKAPSSIDTWSLDDRGIWKKEASAIRNGNYYETSVTHFSFWNLDVPITPIYLTLNLHDQQGNPLPNVAINLTIPNNNTWWGSSYGYTNSNGSVSGFVPINQPLVMNVYGSLYNCVVSFSTQNIGPFSADTTLNVTITIPNPQTILTVTGTANDCNNQPLPNGDVLIYVGNYSCIGTTITNGTYSAIIPYCSSINTINVTLSSNGSVAYSGNLSVTGNSLAVPAMTLCGSAAPAVYNLFNCQPVGFYSVGTPVSSLSNILVSVNVQTPGSYSMSTNTVNGVQFSASGTFASSGSHSVALIGSGSPISGGTYAYNIDAGAGQNCISSIFVNNTNPGTSAGFTGLGCQSSGSFTVGTALGTGNNISLSVYVQTAGAYTIYSDAPVNGMSFSSSGIFTSTGNQTVTLAGTGTPISTGNYNLMIHSNIGDVCSTSLTVAPVPGTQAVYNTLSCFTTGNYVVGTALNNNNAIQVSVNVLSAGEYSINTANPINGMSFSATGTFVNTGNQTVTLFGTGTPVTSGNQNFQVLNSSGAICNTVITVNDIPPAAAVFSLGGPGGCPNVFVAGDYTVGFPLTSSNNVTLMVTVTSTGYYNIITDSINGIRFSGSGIFTVTGVQTIVLQGSGNPVLAGTNTITASANGVTGCSFTVNVINTSSTAGFSFLGAPGVCLNPSVFGIYVAGTPLNGNHGVQLSVDVSSVGAYTITTNTANGISFSRTGVFSSIGQQMVILFGTGTPSATGTNTFTPQAGAAPGCNFTVTTN